jgi:multicomponent K+:H+ antiporter subunit E
MKRWLPFPALSLALAASWLLLTSELSLAHALLAVALGIIIPLLVADFLGHLPRIVSVPAALHLFLLVLRDIVVANIAVARLVLGPTGKLEPVFVRVPLTLTNPQSISLLASIITMTPGTVSAVLDAENRLLLIHALDCTDPGQLIEDIKRRYEQPLLEVFGC